MAGWSSSAKRRRGSGAPVALVPLRFLQVNVFEDYRFNWVIIVCARVYVCFIKYMTWCPLIGDVNQRLYCSS